MNATPPTSPRRHRARRVALAALALAGSGALVVPSCSAPFDPPSRVEALRVLAVEADNPYAVPGEPITLKMQYFDGRRDIEDRPPIQITWIAGCFNPRGDVYYACYEPLGQILSSVSAGEAEATDYLLQGPGFDTFMVTFPDDAIESREAPALGAKLATAFVFFAACAGELRPVDDAGDTDAQSFPFGCFAPDGARLGPDSFVPGYTVLYAYEDGRRNENPEVRELLFDGEPLPEGQVADVELCDVTREERNKSGCAAVDEFTECRTYAVDVDVPRDIAEEDPDSTGIDGEVLDEVVWVNYYAEGGDFDPSVRLLNDADQGYREEHGTVWVPPDEPGRYAIWAIVHDNRGGTRTLARYVDVK